MIRLTLNSFSRIVSKFRKCLLIVTVTVLIYTFYFINLDGSNIQPHELTNNSVPTRVQELKREASPAETCSPRTEVWQEDYVYGDENNTAWPWNKTQTWNCPNNYFNRYSLHRRKVQVECSSGAPRLITTMTDSPSDVQIVEPGNKCLQAFLENCCNDKGTLVPNVMHYVWYADMELGFYTFVSFLSVIRYMKPCVILFHGPYIPRGEFWNYFISVYPNVILVNESLITTVFGRSLAFKEHGSDVMRIKALHEYGGLYMDLDEILIKPIEPLRNFTCTMSKEKPQHLGNQFILAQRRSQFLWLWLKGYKRYNAKQWEFNSIIYPYQLSRKHPTVIHVELFSALKPQQRDPKSLWYTNSDWSRNYAIHLYLRNFVERDTLNMTTIRKENTTIGALFRRVLFGKKEICN